MIAFVTLPSRCQMPRPLLALFLIAGCGSPRADEDESEDGAGGSASLVLVIDTSPSMIEESSLFALELERLATQASG